MLDNLIEKSRTRRGLIKKLKELGLIFKAPTRKSVAERVSKHAWHREQDKILRNLYDTHRLETGTKKVRPRFPFCTQGIISFRLLAQDNGDFR